MTSETTYGAAGPEKTTKDTILESGASMTQVIYNHHVARQTGYVADSILHRTLLR